MNGIAPTRLNGRLVRIVGWLIVAAALFYVGQRLATNFDKISAVEVTAERLSVLAICAVGYAAILIPLAIVWGRLANAGNPSPPSVWQSISIYGRAQFAKYLPGNIFHYAGRQVLGRQLGWSQSGMAMASILEILLVVAAAGSVILAYGAFVEDALFTLVPKAALAIALVIGIVMPSLIIFGARRTPAIARFLSIEDSLDALTGNVLPYTFLVYLSYFLFSGLFSGLAVGMLGFTIDMEQFPLIAAGFVASWLAGYLTPGASGGIGVREAAFTALLAGTLGEPEALTLALSLRVATTLGDVLNFMASLHIQRRVVASARPPRHERH